MNKDKKMVLVIKKQGNTTTYERIGDDLSKELRGHVLRDIQSELLKNKSI